MKTVFKTDFLASFAPLLYLRNSFSEVLLFQLCNTCANSTKLSRCSMCLLLTGDSNDNKPAVVAEEEEVAKMGCPSLGEHTKLEVVIEESYEFKVSPVNQEKQCSNAAQFLTFNLSESLPPPSHGDSLNTGGHWGQVAQGFRRDLGWKAAAALRMQNKQMARTV